MVVVGGLIAFGVELGVGLDKRDEEAVGRAKDEDDRGLTVEESESDFLSGDLRNGLLVVVLVSEAFRRVATGFAGEAFGMGFLTGLVVFSGTTGEPHPFFDLARKEAVGWETSLDEIDDFRDEVVVPWVRTAVSEAARLLDATSVFLTLFIGDKGFLSTFFSKIGEVDCIGFVDRASTLAGSCTTASSFLSGMTG